MENQIPKVENRADAVFGNENVVGSADASFNASVDVKPEANNGDLETNSKVPVLNELEEELQRLRNHNLKLVDESKRFRREKEKAYEEKLKAENNKDELLKLKDAKLEAYKKKEMSLNITSAIAEEAAKRGCEHWDFLFQTGDTSSINYDEETGDVAGVQDFFDLHQNNPKYSIYFAQGKEFKTNNAIPSVTLDAELKSNPLAFIKKLKAEAVQTGDYNKYQLAVSKLQKDGLLR